MRYEYVCGDESIILYLRKCVYCKTSLAIVMYPHGKMCIYCRAKKNDKEVHNNGKVPLIIKNKSYTYLRNRLIPIKRKRKKTVYKIPYRDKEKEEIEKQRLIYEQNNNIL